MSAVPVADLVLPDPEAPDRPLRFVLGIDPTVRLAVGLRIADRHSVDVSRQPGVLARAAGERAADVAARCRRVCSDHGLWLAPANASVLVVTGGAAFPILGATYERGADALASVPRWAAPVLAEASPGPAARRAFDTRSTRATARAIPVSLGVAPGRTPRLAGLGLAIGGADVLEPDEIVAVLRHGADNAAVLTSDDIRALRRAARMWGRRVVAPLLREVAGATAATARLVTALSMWGSVGRRFDRRVPHRLDDLVAELRDAMPVDPGPPAALRPDRPPASGTPSAVTPAPPRAARTDDPATGPTPAPRPVARQAAAGTPVPDARPPHHVPQMAPIRTSTPSTRTSLPVHARLAPLDGAHLDRSLRLVLPRSTWELAAWGTRLQNCLGDYCASALAGRSLIVGVERSGRLTYCVELTADFRVRQFVGHRNRPPTAADETVVLAALADAPDLRRLPLR